MYAPYNPTEIEGIAALESIVVKTIGFETIRLEILTWLVWFLYSIANFCNYFTQALFLLK